MTKNIRKTVYRTSLKNAARSHSIAIGFVNGVASLLTIATPPQKTLRRKTESSEKALRGDFVRIGMDMRKAAAKVMSDEKTAR